MRFRISDYLPDFKRLPADWLLGAALSLIGSAIGTVWVATANPPNITSLGWLTVFLTLAFVLLALIAFGAWVIGWTKRQWQQAPTDRRAPIQPKKNDYVQFRIPYTWEVGPGFKLKTLPEDETGQRDQAEEIHAFVLVTHIMRNVQFEIRAMRERGRDWETIARISSTKFVGTVHKEMRESFVVMRRTFRYIATQYHDPFLGAKRNITVRAEKDIVIFPDDAAAFPAKLGEEYLFHITIYHDDGPERAYFKIKLDSSLSVPQSRFTLRENIEFIFARK